VASIYAIESAEIEATIVMIQIWEFPQVAQGCAPGAAARLLNANFEVLIPELSARGGVIDKLLGDAVLAVFHGSDHLSRALDGCLAARAQIEALARRAGARSPYAQGVAAGVATSQLLPCAVGSRTLNRLDYTVVGEAVTTATHLMAAAGHGQILVDERVRQAAPAAFVFNPSDVLSVDGSQRIETAYLTHRLNGVPLPMDATLSDDQRRLDETSISSRRPA
jgi:class 3 adenylate cyclase